jgi:hypothetical protein
VNILLVGEESAGIQTLKALAGGDHRIIAVMASPSKNNGVLASLCWDEWIVANRLKVEERYVNAAQVLKPGNRLKWDRL